MIDLKKIKKIHFTGIKGVGMTALALVVKDMGIKASGSDIGESFVTDETLKKTGISWQKGFSEKNVKDVDLLVFSAGHEGVNNVEVKKARKEDIPVLSHGQALALMMRSKKAICVAGVGGKTSTSSMIATVFNQAKASPSYAIGVGRINPLGLPGKFNKKGKYFITEADEYFSPAPELKPKFWYLNPFVAVITNLAYDHPDVYKNLDHTLKVFAKFIERVPEDGLVLACLDNPQTKSLMQLTKKPITTYGFSEKADWQIISVKQDEEKIIFSLKYQKKEFKNITLSVPGDFNVKNAAAAFIVSKFCGFKEKKIKQGLEAFKGTQRRFELVAEVNNIKLYDDYAHHPDQIKATLKGAREWFRHKKIIVIFQPHTFTRTKALLEEFGSSFKNTDLVIITDIYPSAREKIDPSISGRKLVKEIKKHQDNVVYKKGKEEVAEYLKEIVKSGNIVFTVGAGNIFNWHQSIIKTLGGKDNKSNLDIRKNVKLAPYTTFNIGGLAEYFLKAKTKEQIIEAIQWAKKKKIPYFILGKGSNVLISDKGFKGLVVKAEYDQVRVDGERIIVEAGMVLAQLVSLAKEKLLSGLEVLAGVPGTVGAAIVGNSGTKEGGIGEKVEKVLVLGEDGLVYDLTKKECQFKYRSSRFKRTKEIVLEIVFKLKKEDNSKIIEKEKQILEKRKNQPVGKNVGSIFKNPLNKPAGYLIEKAGLKGEKIGGAMVSKKHANWIINLNNAKANDVVQLIRLIKDKVRKKFKINLKEEIALIGDF